MSTLMWRIKSTVKVFFIFNFTKFMRSIKARFYRYYKDPISSYMAFAAAINGKDFSYNSITKNFSELVNVDDYDKADRKQLIKGLMSLTKPSEDDNKQL